MRDDVLRALLEAVKRHNAVAAVHVSEMTDDATIAALADRLLEVSVADRVAAVTELATRSRDLEVARMTFDQWLRTGERLVVTQSYPPEGAINRDLYVHHVRAGIALALQRFLQADQYYLIRLKIDQQQAYSLADPLNRFDEIRGILHVARIDGVQ